MLTHRQSPPGKTHRCGRNDTTGRRRQSRGVSSEYAKERSDASAGAAECAGDDVEKPVPPEVQPEVRDGRGDRNDHGAAATVRESALGITPKKTRLHRPQTNGKIERFHRTITDGWAYARFYGTETERRQALPGWLHFYNHHQRHSTIGAPPISRLTSIPPEVTVQ